MEDTLIISTLMNFLVAVVFFGLLCGIFDRLGQIRQLLRLAHQAYLAQASAAPPAQPPAARTAA